MFFDEFTLRAALEWLLSHDISLFLQFKILERMRSFGMIPVLPAFSGNIPKGILRWLIIISLSMFQSYATLLTREDVSLCLCCWN